MVDYTKSAIFLLRSWISQEFLNSDLIDQDDYNDIDPIIPIQDIETTNKKLGKLPYITYSMFQSPIESTEFYRKNEVAVLTVFSNNYSELAAIGNFLMDILDRNDNSAEDINIFLGSPIINFKWTRFLKANEPVPTSQPAGRFIQTLMFSYEYTRQVGDNSRFSL